MADIAGRVLGYARVSTWEQDTALQLDALKRHGVVDLYSESGSAVGPRPVLKAALLGLRSGDMLVVWKLDRIARDLYDLLGLLNKLQALGVMFRSLTEPIDTSTPLGIFMVQMLGAVAQLERAMIRERVLAGQVAHIQRGGSHGRPRQLTDVQQGLVKALAIAGHTQAEIARQMSVSRAVVDRVMNPWRSRYQPQRPVLGPLLAQSPALLDAPK
ncbi:recombinase family protein [Paracidovorax anthurii]|nr:recombinase family protein [Paracidovorax anthurii]